MIRAALQLRQDGVAGLRLNDKDGHSRSLLSVGSEETHGLELIDKERARNSRAVEVLGYYNPLTHPATVKVDYGRVEHWLKAGARPSDTVARLLKSNPAPAA